MPGFPLEEKERSWAVLGEPGGQLADLVKGLAELPDLWWDRESVRAAPRQSPGELCSSVSDKCLPGGVWF